MNEQPIKVKDVYESKPPPKKALSNFKFTFNTSEKDRLKVNLHYIQFFIGILF